MDRLIAKMRDKMDLKVESDDVSNFLGIKFTRHGDTVELTQTGLIEKIIGASLLKTPNAMPTSIVFWSRPASTIRETFTTSIQNGWLP